MLGDSLRMGMTTDSSGFIIWFQGPLPPGFKSPLYRRLGRLVFRFHT